MSSTNGISPLALALLITAGRESGRRDFQPPGLGGFVGPGLGFGGPGSGPASILREVLLFQALEKIGGSNTTPTPAGPVGGVSPAPVNPVPVPSPVPVLSKPANSNIPILPVTSGSTLVGPSNDPGVFNLAQNADGSITYTDDASGNSANLTESPNSLPGLYSGSLANGDAVSYIAPSADLLGSGMGQTASLLITGTDGISSQDYSYANTTGSQWTSSATEVYPDFDSGTPQPFVLTQNADGSFTYTDNSTGNTAQLTASNTLLGLNGNAVYTGQLSDGTSILFDQDPSDATQDQLSLMSSDGSSEVNYVSPDGNLVTPVEVPLMSS
jgi:hypothetical protein